MIPSPVPHPSYLHQMMAAPSTIAMAINDPGTVQQTQHALTG